jgi:hypothetical protein
VVGAVGSKWILIVGERDRSLNEAGPKHQNQAVDGEASGGSPEGAQTFEAGWNCSVFSRPEGNFLNAGVLLALVHEWTNGIPFNWPLSRISRLSK